MVEAPVVGAVEGPQFGQDVGVDGGVRAALAVGQTLLTGVVTQTEETPRLVVVKQVGGDLVLQTQEPGKIKC